jgi:hypothetical protein
MPITPERLHEFMRLYEEEFSESINEDEAREITSRLVELYCLLAEPLPSEQSHFAALESSLNTDEATVHECVPSHQ